MWVKKQTKKVGKMQTILWYLHDFLQWTLKMKTKSDHNLGGTESRFRKFNNGDDIIKPISQLINTQVLLIDC